MAFLLYIGEGCILVEAQNTCLVVAVENYAEE